MNAVRRFDFLIVKNCAREGGGLLEVLLEKEGLSFTSIDLDAGDAFPDANTYHGLIVMGGPDSANDDTPKMKQEIEVIRDHVRSGKPYFGVCLGLQTLVKALGGSVVRNPVKEIGFHDPSGEQFAVDLTALGVKDPLLKGLPSSFPVFQLHGETVVPAKGMATLGTGEYCVEQIIRAAPLAYGVQFHIELTEQMFEEWIKEDSELRTMHKEQLRKEFQDSRAIFEEHLTIMFGNFLSLARSSTAVSA
jgi:GMP synthase-like glutamine amidotransferase